MGNFISSTLGYLRKDSLFYIFSKLVDQEYTLSSYIERLREKNVNAPYQAFNEIERLLGFLIKSIDVLQGEEITYLTVIEPTMIIVEEREKGLSFRYGFPLVEAVLVDRDSNKGLIALYKDKMEFAAP